MSSRTSTQSHVSCRLLLSTAVVALLAIVATVRGSEPPEAMPAENQAADKPGSIRQDTCRILADQNLDEPIRAIVAEYVQRTAAEVDLCLLPADRIHRLIEAEQADDADLVVALAKQGEDTPVSLLPGATQVAWKHPTGEPVWGAVLDDHASAAELLRFLGGPTGHRLWSESTAGFTIVSGKSRAEAFAWVAENRVAHTYPMTAIRMLRECGNPQEGICIDVGCGPGNLDVELARRSNVTIIGLDIDADMKPLFDKKMREAGFQDRVRFVQGDAQKLPFPDDYADMIVSRGVLTFLPDLAEALREVSRVLKPSGVAFLGGRYIYTPQAYKMTDDQLQRAVVESGVPGAQVVTDRGQWVKILGPQAPDAARQPAHGPQLLAYRFLADYAIAEGDCLLLCQTDSDSALSLQRGFLETTNLKITALYSDEPQAAKARQRIGEARHEDRITCTVGSVDHLPFQAGTFDAVIGVGPILLWGEREQRMAEISRVLRDGGVALVGGRFLGMPEWRRVPSETLRASAAKTGIPSIRVLDDMGQWVEIRKGIGDRRFRD